MLHCRYSQAVNIDDAVLDALQGRVSHQLAAAQQIHLTSPLGTDLTLNIGGRPIHQDNNGLPRGEVYVAPLEDSANGVVVSDRAFIRGQAVDGLMLTFERGRVVSINAPQPDSVRLFTELLAASNGDKDRIAEFGIGLNPGVKDLSGDIMLDEKLNSSVHVALGMNDHFGGQNHSNLHLDLVMLHPCLWLDGNPLNLPD